LIGKTDFSTPNNITKVGYLTKQEDIAVVLNKADGFLNLTYRDAATKTIPQAISCGLPVLYADSGGVSEMVGQYGVGIPEEDDIAFSTSIPHLTQSQLEKGFKEYKDKYQGILDQLKSFDPNTKFKEMLAGYFKAIKSVL
jgi:glycosyltransferase involved in cell wall biosynthesis